ncbi:MAG: tetratricopeptide repeat protein, partial [Sedimenticola sp.]
MRSSATLRATLLAAMLTPLPGAADWFENDQQKGDRLFQAGRYLEAADAFGDNYRKGVALYRAEEYDAAADAFESNDRDEVHLDALYNLGNTRYRQDRFADAIEAYDQVLEEDPEHPDAQHNRGLALAMLA